MSGCPTWRKINYYPFAINPCFDSRTGIALCLVNRPQGAREDEMTPMIERLMRKAESGADWAEICRLEAELKNGPFFAHVCEECGMAYDHHEELCSHFQ